ncbi:MAG TPA: hypothetical protein VNL74_08415 [Methylococcus sp.]|nr:hypothetical protein [Methylococcus sp.]
MPDVGELVVGAWLTQVEAYDFVVYNQRPGRDLPESVAPKGTSGVSARLGELDVIGLNTPKRQSYLAQCTTHLGGMLYTGGPRASVERLKRKFTLSSAYADILEERTGLKPKLAFWSPKVPKAVIEQLKEVEEAARRPIEVVANDAYTDRVMQLIDAARLRTTGTGNDFYRTLQLLTHLTRSPFVDLPRPTRNRLAEASLKLAADASVLPWSEVVKVHRTRAGIRAPRGGSEASIICNTGAHGPYPDRFLGPDVLHYVGRGLEGDQDLDRDNESLRQAIERGIPIRVFEQVGKNRYIDHGVWEGVGEPLWHHDAGSNRRLIVFTLRRLPRG